MRLTRLRETLKKHEGFRSTPYKDTVGKLTIGYGRNLEDVGVSEPEALILLGHDIQKAYDQLYERIPDIMDSLNAPRQEVLVNMAFNLGVPGLLRFRKTLALIQTKNYDAASYEMLDSKWATQVGKRALELSEVMREGKWILKP